MENRLESKGGGGLEDIGVVVMGSAVAAVSSGEGAKGRSRVGMQETSLPSASSWALFSGKDVPSVLLR